MDPVILKKARLTLPRRDAILKSIIRSVGPCTLQANGDAFEVLVRSIISQQISTKAAIAISGRVLEKLGKFQPKLILDASDDDLRSAGLSRGKLASLRDLATKCADGTVFATGPRFALCRCGQSGNKPFCDGAHRAAGFRAP